MTAPLEGVLVVDFSQFLAGPYASLRLLDLGARVIKVENPGGGDLCRRHYLSDTEIDGDSTLFHAINRGKESIALDLKSPEGLAKAQRLAARADVMIQNFRPGVIERLGLGYASVTALRSDIVYGSISGYGEAGEWAGLPGQDLLAQARSGVMWLSGNAGQGPVPIGLPLADISAGANLAQGLLAALFRRERTGVGAKVETSLLASLLDLQFEFLTTYLSNGRRPPERMAEGSAHGYLAAPYGVYPTRRGHLALAMTPLDRLAALLDLPEIAKGAEGAGSPWALEARERVYAMLARRFREKTAAEWESALGREGVWCAEVLDWEQLMQTKSFAALGLARQADHGAQGAHVQMAAPIRVDGASRPSPSAAPALNADGDRIAAEFGLDAA